MTSCSNSTITGISINTTEAISGRRIAFQQQTNVNWDSSITAGDVIRYDVDDAKFTRSIADPDYDDNGLSNAEVIGIVEKIEQVSGVTYATIVTSGLMVYPNLTSTIAGISASSGGIGGTDVFFLSPSVPGGITFELVEQRGFIVKPVLQVCPVAGTNYNSVVINYLGYESSEASDYTVRSSESTIGDIKVVDSGSSIPEGWVDTSIPQFLPVSEYSSAYALYGTSYGSYEKLSVNGSVSFVSGLVGKSIRPLNPTTKRGVGAYGLVISANTVENYIIVEHNSTNEILWNSSYSTYEISEPVANLTKVTVTSGEITHFKTPKISLNVDAKVGTSTQVLDFSTKTLLRVKPDTVVSYLPENVNFNNLVIGGTMSTENIANVDSKLVDLEARIQVLEQKLGI